MKRLLIVRHGDTFLPGETPRRIGARTDLPLTPRGEAQARDLGAWLAERRVTIGAGFCGPLQRTRDTAALLLAACGAAADLRVVPWLNEIDHGPDEGHDEAAVVARIGAAALAAWESAGTVPPGWLVDPAARIEAWRAAAAGLDDGVTLFVTSNGAARFAVRALVPPPWPTSLKLRTGAAGQIVIDGGTTSLVDWDSRPGDA